MTLKNIVTVKPTDPGLSFAADSIGLCHHSLVHIKLGKKLV